MESSSDNSSDERWIPSMDAPTQTKGVQVHGSKRLKKETEEVTIIDDQASTSIIAPTKRTSTFNVDEVVTIHTQFKDMICKSTAIFKKVVEKRCSSSRDERALMQKLSALTLHNQFKYERRKFRNGLENKRQ